MNEYYVYIYWRLDINEPFYIGKGKGYRYIHLYNRNEHFNNILNKIPTMVEIFKENLTNEQASDIECWLINELVFEYGFSIDIKNNYSTDHYCHLCNMTWGGDGASGYFKSEETKRKIGESHKGINPFKNKTEEEINIINKKRSNSMKGRLLGKDNPMYGKNPYENKTKEEMEEIGSRISTSQMGEKNHKYGKRGKDSPFAKSVICLTTKRIFYSVKEGAKYYGLKKGSDISNCCKGYKISKGKKYKSNYAGKLSDGTPLVWKYLTWKHNKKYRIKDIRR